MGIEEKLIKLLDDFPVQMEWHDTNELADHLVVNGVTIQQWIPVTERLPESSGEYLVYCGEYDGICILHYEVLKTKGKFKTKWKTVTHWMPLPDSPKEGAMNGL